MKYKQNHILGIFLHSFVHFILSIILVFPFINDTKLLWSIVLIFLAHSIVDQIKVLVCKNTKINEFIVYVLDQLTHVAIILFASLYLIGKVNMNISGWWTAFYYNKSIISFLLILVLSTYFFDISKWVYINTKNPHPYKRGYKMMLKNGIIVLTAFVIYWIAL